VLVLTGCGVGAGGGWQTVTGQGFRVAVPAGWTVTRTSGILAASHGRIARVQVQRFRLVRPYRSTLFAAAARELDGVATEVARELHGHVTARSTVEVDGADARSYRVAFGQLVEELTFLLDGRTEFELLCRRAAATGDRVCADFVSRFALT